MHFSPTQSGTDYKHDSFLKSNDIFLFHSLADYFFSEKSYINFVYTSLTIEIFFISTIVINYTLTIKVVKMFITRQLVVMYNIYMYFKMTVNSNDT